jgi:hypothetical protein
MKNWLRKRKPVFTANQLNRISNIFDSAGQIVFGVAVVSPFVSEVDKYNIRVVILGILIALALWITSVWFAKKR